VVDGNNVPRVTRQGARQEGALVVNEVGDDQVQELVRDPGYWARVCGRRLWVGGTIEQRLDFGFASVPKYVNKQSNRCNSIETARLLN
jgi:hypothetical protein